MKREFLDFKAIKEHVPIVSLCARYGIELKRRNAAQFVARKCPLPTHDNPKSIDTFAVNSDRNGWYCHHDSCKRSGASGNVIDLAMRMSGLAQYDAAKLLLEWFPISGNPATHPATISESLDSHIHEPATMGTSHNKPLAFALKGIEHEHPMIQGKGISVETAKEYGIGLFSGKGSMSGRIVFPLYEEQVEDWGSVTVRGHCVWPVTHAELVGYAGRLVGEPTPIYDKKTGEQVGMEPKWKLPSGFHKSFAYGLEKCDPKYPLIIGESFWLPPFMKERGKQAASLMGTDLSERQEAQLLPFKVLWICLDNDEKGREASEKLAARLRTNHAVKIARLRE